MKVSACLLFILGLFSYSAKATDCFSWSVTKRAEYLDVLGSLMYYDMINWINLDASKTCSFSAYGDTNVKFFSNDLTATYQEFYKADDLSCTLDTETYDISNYQWLYSQSLFADPTLCGFRLSITNGHVSEAQMFQVIRTNAELLKSSFALIASVFTMFYLSNL